MEIESKDSGLLEALRDSYSFRRNPATWSAFYGASFATLVMFIILCTLSAWSITMAHNITDVVRQSKEILRDVEQMLPALRAICQHENFTKNYGDICR